MAPGRRRAAEIGHGRVLASLDDAAADRPGPGEIFLEMRAVPGAHGEEIGAVDQADILAEGIEADVEAAAAALDPQPAGGRVPDDLAKRRRDLY